VAVAPVERPVVAQAERRPARAATTTKTRPSRPRTAEVRPKRTRPAKAAARAGARRSAVRPRAPLASAPEPFSLDTGSSIPLLPVGGLAGLALVLAMLGAARVRRTAAALVPPTTFADVIVPVVAPARQDATQWCEVVWFRGYVRSQFSAHVIESDEPCALAASPWFQWRAAERPPRTPQTEAALADVVASLEADGWECAGQRYAWYELVFRRGGE
jgi:hypothetical protein